MSTIGKRKHKRNEMKKKTKKKCMARVMVFITLLCTRMKHNRKEKKIKKISFSVRWKREKFSIANEMKDEIEEKNEEKETK